MPTFDDIRTNLVEAMQRIDDEIARLQDLRSNLEKVNNATTETARRFTVAALSLYGPVPPAPPSYQPPPPAPPFAPVATSAPEAAKAS